MLGSSLHSNVAHHKSVNHTVAEGYHANNEETEDPIICRTRIKILCKQIKYQQLRVKQIQENRKLENNVKKQATSNVQNKNMSTLNSKLYSTVSDTLKERDMKNDFDFFSKL